MKLSEQHYLTILTVIHETVFLCSKKGSETTVVTHSSDQEFVQCFETRWWRAVLELFLRRPDEPDQTCSSQTNLPEKHKEV